MCGAMSYHRIVEVDFILGDITDLNSKDWTEGDILFANSTCFDDKVRDQSYVCVAYKLTVPPFLLHNCR